MSGSEVGTGSSGLRMGVEMTERLAGVPSLPTSAEPPVPIAEQTDPVLPVEQEPVVQEAPPAAALTEEDIQSQRDHVRQVAKIAALQPTTEGSV